jgi:hypothetical protein
MQEGDILTAVLTALSLGGGLLLQTVHKRLVRPIGGFLIAASVVGLVVWFGCFRTAGAQNAAPAQQENDTIINNGGIATQHQKGNNTINKYGPPHRVNTLYDGDSELGFVDVPITISDDKKHITFGKMSYYDGFPWGKTITFQAQAGAYLITCSENQICPTGMCASGQGNMSGQLMNVHIPATCELK